MTVMRIHLNLLQMINLQVLNGEVNQKKEVAGRLKMCEHNKKLINSIHKMNAGSKKPGIS